jgi:anti-anti-sigma factor
MVRPSKFEISEDTVGGTRVLAVSGELDLSTAPGLAEKVVPGAAGDLTIDLSELTFMDSSGLRLLIELDQRARQEGTKLTLIHSRHEAAKTVLRLTGADEALPFEREPER